MLCALPGLMATVFLLWLGDFNHSTWIAVLYLLLFFSTVVGWMLLDSVRRPWQILSNILSAFGEQDYSMRGSSAEPGDPIGLAMWETNRLADLLQEERRIRLEQNLLLDRILRETDIAIFCFNADNRLVIVNQYAANLYGLLPEKLVGRTLEQLQLGFALTAAHSTGHTHRFPQRESRWLVKHGAYRERGRPHRIILLADIRETLREEELEAWRKLIRVLGHELINSMTPMKTMAAGMQRILQQETLPDDWKEDLDEGFRVIINRVDNMSRFVKNYSRIARQPQPEKSPVSIQSLLQRLVAMEAYQGIRLRGGPDIEVSMDEAQIEQVLINLFKNAIEATESKPGAVWVQWFESEAHGRRQLRLEVLDDGHGISNPDNLFVPYFTTKAEGNGIGLIVSRQIAEAHRGSLMLENRRGSGGCCATLILPVT